MVKEPNDTLKTRVIMREGLYVIEQERICYSILVVWRGDGMEYEKRWKMVYE